MHRPRGGGKNISPIRLFIFFYEYGIGQTELISDGERLQGSEKRQGHPIPHITFREKNKTIRAGIPTKGDSCFIMEEQ